MLPRPSTTISFARCPAWTAIDPPGSWRRSLSFDELAVLEYRAGTDQRDELGCVDGPPPGLC
jgi:hypothetical protein